MGQQSGRVLKHTRWRCQICGVVCDFTSSSRDSQEFHFLISWQSGVSLPHLVTVRSFTLGSFIRALEQVCYISWRWRRRMNHHLIISFLLLVFASSGLGSTEELHVSSPEMVEKINSLNVGYVSRILPIQKRNVILYHIPWKRRQQERKRWIYCWN